MFIMFYSFVLIIAGFFLLVYGADYFVKGAASIARLLGISALAVGLTVVAIGTSAPEFFVNIIAASQGATDLSVGNILGSNLADILLGLGIAAIIIPIQLKKGTVWREIPFSLLAAAFILIFGSDLLLEGQLPNEISRIDGLALLGFFIIFIVYTFSLRERKGEQPDKHIETYSRTLSITYILGGLTALALGGVIVVEGAVSLATLVGVSENLIGLTIVAAGTSLPEIVTAIVAAKRGQIDFVVGGIVGTIIFNALFVLGATALITPLPFSTENMTDSSAVLFATLLFIPLMFVGRRQFLTKKKGYLLVFLYIAYMIFAVLRG